MNLNEHCLLNFLVNPDEISDISNFFIRETGRINDKKGQEGIKESINNTGRKNPR